MKKKVRCAVFLSISLLITGFSYAQVFLNADYEHGLKATNVSPNDMANVYNSWKSNWVEVCNNGGLRVKWNDPNFTVSEGIAYGMLLSAYANDQETFDGLWLYYKDNVNQRGVMNWKIEGCNTINGPNGATDAELDAACALMVADVRWGNSGVTNYNTEAKQLINLIKIHEVEAGSNVLKPGDAWGGSDNTNPSYFATGYFRAFGEYTNDRAFWNAVASKSYEIINNNLSKNNAAYNFVSDWTEADGDYSPVVASWAFDQGKSYYYDAARTPWRAAIDYVWYGNNEAKNYASLCNDFVNSIGGFDKILPGYRQNGTPIDPSYKDPAFTGAYALAAMTSGNQNFVNAGYSELKNQVSMAYFAATLRAIYMFGMSGNLFNPVSSALSNDELHNVNRFKLFPNPASNVLNISFKTAGNYEIKVNDITGKLIHKETSSESSTQLELSHYPSGMYFLSINNEKFKFVKK